MLLPAYFSNMAPIVFRRSFSFLDIPVDLGTKIGQNRLFGERKTIRGFMVGVVCAILVSFLQSILYANFTFFREFSLIDFEKNNFVSVGFLLGFGALFGDLVESFIKRRLGKKPSEPWEVFDQLDYIAGALIFIYPVYKINLSEAFVAFFLSFFLTIIVNHIGYALKMRKKAKSLF